ncbi:MAG: prolyl oligopeptidase family serine peptidase, partial [Acholeplasmataceae bacterium]
MEKRENYLKINYYDNKKRPLLLILPGGGYHVTSEREAEPISGEFIKIGFHQAIFYYRETHYKYPLILDDAINHIMTLKNDELVSDIHIMGFSAGGHLAGLLLTKYPKFFKSGILCYPVVSTKKEIIHISSFENLLKDYPNELDEVSIEKLVNQDTPPI